jgi:hypothetical protein
LRDPLIVLKRQQPAIRRIMPPTTMVAGHRSRGHERGEMQRPWGMECHDIRIPNVHIGKNYDRT